MRLSSTLQPFTGIEHRAAVLDIYGLGAAAMRDAARLYAEDGTTLVNVVQANLVLAAVRPREMWVDRALEAGDLQRLAVTRAGAIVMRPARPPSRAFVSGAHRAVAAGEEVQALLTGPAEIPLVTSNACLREGSRARCPPLPTPSSATGRKPVLPRSWTASERLYEIDIETPSWLVVMEAFAPGWHATIDGTSATIHRIDRFGRGVYLEAGRHEVRFHYGMPGQAAAFWLSRLAMLGLALFGLWRWRRHAKNDA